MKHTLQRHIIEIAVMLIVAVSLLFYTYSYHPNHFEQVEPYEANTQAEQQPMQETTGSGVETKQMTVYWTTYGEVYHLRMDCQALAHATTIHCGSIESSGKARICKFCAQKASP
ncbi:MAG: hypothetical protein Q4P20_08940 [Eubacteriales bacterium]|nr:hypothetical protein [Eubacteriales bacterium]